MKIGDSSRTGKIVSCEGEITIASGVLSINCSKCAGRMEIWHPECFNGLSQRMIPGFKGQVVMKGEIHRSYEGPVIDAISAHSQILRDIRNLGGLEDRSRKRLERIVSEIEKELLTDPIKLIERKELYLTKIRKTLRMKEPPEAERFQSIVASTTKMVRRLEREIPKGE